MPVEEVNFRCSKCNRRIKIDTKDLINNRIVFCKSCELVADLLKP